MFFSGVDGMYQVVLKEVELPMWKHAQCQRALRTHERIPSRFFKNYELSLIRAHVRENV